MSRWTLLITHYSLLITYDCLSRDAGRPGLSRGPGQLPQAGRRAVRRQAGRRQPTVCRPEGRGGVGTDGLARRPRRRPLGRRRARPLAVYVPSGTTRYLYLGVRFDSGGKVYQWDGTTATALITLEGATPEYLFGFDGKLYGACADAGGGRLLYSFDGTNWRLVLQQSETWIQSGAAFGERYYLGSGRDNRVWAFNGRDLVEVFAGYSPHGSRVRGLVAFG